MFRLQLIIIYICFSATIVLAQGVAVNTTGTPADSSSILDISSTTKGVLITRLTLTERDAIGSPATGLLIYQTDNTPGFYYYNGSSWNLVGADYVKDVDNNKYNTIAIGTQVWMAENLRVTRYNDSTPIPLVTDVYAWQALMSPGYTWYDNAASDYGALYNYYTIADTNTRNICPVGWHVPSDTELTTLTTYLGGESVAGGKMKEGGLTHWLAPNTNATNESEFMALPGGYRDTGTFSGAFFAHKGDRAYLWSSTEDDNIRAWYRYMGSADGVINRFMTDKTDGFSVRCLKD